MGRGKSIEGAIGSEGITGFLHRMWEHALLTVSLRLLDVKMLYQLSHRKLFREAGIQLCINDRSTQQYDPLKYNVAILIEAPAVVEEKGWVDRELNFDAEVSFGNFYELDDYHCPRGYYSIFDDFVGFDPEQSYERKTKLISHVYSAKTNLEGHQLRHEVEREFADILDSFGTGANNYVEDKIDTLEEYRFQVVIENSKHPDYVSEKFFDCLKTETIPIYWGGERTVRELGFDTDGVFFFESIEDLEEILDEVVSKPVYQERRSAVTFNKRRLVELRNRIRFGFFYHLESLGGAMDDSAKRNLWLERIL